MVFCSTPVRSLAAVAEGSQAHSAHFSASVTAHGAFVDADERDGGSRQGRERNRLLRQADGLEPGQDSDALDVHPVAFMQETGTPVNCEWAPWGEWTACPVTCGGGSQARERIRSPEASDGGKPCDGSTREVIQCQLQGCPVDCSFGPWASWSLCTKSCGGGTIKRFRPQINQTKNGGQECVGGPSQSQDCNIGGCPVDCMYAEWANWGSCTKTCGGGTQERSRNIKTPAVNGGRACSVVHGASTGSQTCAAQGCPTPCEWGPWGQWDQCTKTCGGGQVTRSRATAKEATNGGAVCGSPGPTETAVCNDLSCDLIHAAAAARSSGSNASSASSPAVSSASASPSPAASPTAANVTGDMTLSVDNPAAFLSNPNVSAAMKDGVADVSGVSASVVTVGLTAKENITEAGLLQDIRAHERAGGSDANVDVWYSIDVSGAASMAQTRVSDANETASEVLARLQALQSDAVNAALEKELKIHGVAASSVAVQSVKASVEYSAAPTPAPTPATQQSVSSANSPTPSVAASGSPSPSSTVPTPAPPSAAQRWTSSLGVSFAVTMMAVLG